MVFCGRRHTCFLRNEEKYKNFTIRVNGDCEMFVSQSNKAPYKELVSSPLKKEEVEKKYSTLNPLQKNAQALT